MFSPRRSRVKIIQEVIEQVALCFVTNARGIGVLEGFWGKGDAGAVAPMMYGGTPQLNSSPEISECLFQPIDLNIVKLS